MSLVVIAVCCLLYNFIIKEFLNKKCKNLLTISKKLKINYNKSIKKQYN